ncbi:hypothetical protein TKK_0016140 [Trichogramma kaykai]
MELMLCQYYHHVVFMIDTHKDNARWFHNSPLPISDLDKSVKSAIILLSDFFASQNLPACLIDPFVPLLKRCFPDSTILSNVFLSRYKLTEVIKRLICPVRKQKLTDILKKQKFSIIIDESTDRGLLHCICIIVRFIDYENQKIGEGLWDLVDIYDSKEALASSEQISKKVLKSFVDKGVPVENIFGFCSDTCNCMLVVAGILQANNSNVFFTKCPAHMEQLAVKNAIKEFSDDVQHFLTLIINFISASGKRSKFSHYIQEECSVDALKMVKPGFTRRMSWINSVSYVLSRWHALKDNFKQLNEIEKNKEVSEILSFVEKPEMKYYLIFFKFILSKCSSTNVQLQSITPIFTDSTDKMSELLKNVLLMYMKSDVVNSTELLEINPADKKKYAFD